MTTRETLEAYFNALGAGKSWVDFFSEDVEFSSFTSPVKTITGKAAFIEGTKRFYSTVSEMVLRDLIVEGDRGCALTRYELRSPQGGTFTSDVAEVFSVRDGKISTFGIYFDTAPYPARRPEAERSATTAGS